LNVWKKRGREQGKVKEEDDKDKNYADDGSDMVLAEG